jgi:hypothetical protein
MPRPWAEGILPVSSPFLSKCEFGFSRKGLQCQMDLQLAAKD